MITSSALAAGKAQGGCVVRDTDRDGPAPIYRSEDGDKVEAWAMRGDCFGGISTVGLTRQYQFEHKNDRLHILYLTKGVKSPLKIVNPGMESTAWINASDVETFLYECGCGFGEGRECGPTALEGFIDRTWNVCFQEARDKKLAELKLRWTQGAAPQPAGVAADTTVETPASSKAPLEKPLTNDDVIFMLKADLGDQLTIEKIRQAPVTRFDVSAEGLVKMKKDGASKAVIDAVLKRAGEEKTN
jgi:hypothetical protein